MDFRTLAEIVFLVAFLVAPAAMAQGEPAVSVAALSATVETGRPTRIPHRWLASLRLRCAHVGAHPIGGCGPQTKNLKFGLGHGPRCHLALTLNTCTNHKLRDRLPPTLGWTARCAIPRFPRSCAPGYGIRPRTPLCLQEARQAQL